MAVETALAVAVVALAVAALYIPPAWRADFRPPPDAVEYAVTAQRLARFDSYALPLLGRHYPPRYPFGFPALLAPAYWLPGATLANGIYSVVAYGVLGVALTYALGRLLWGRAVGLVAAVALLLLPQYPGWSHAIMSETATVALVAAAALLLCLAAGADGGRRRLALLAGLGGVAGLAILVRLANVVLPVALVAALVGVRRPRHELARGALAVGAGPAVALAGLAVYALATFGSVLGTGYRYWVPEWYAVPGQAFALAYAFGAPAPLGDPAAPAGLPNGLYYARSLLGLLPERSSLFLTGEFCALACVGAVNIARDRRRPVRAFAVFAGLFSTLTLSLYAVYFVRDARFLAPLAPLAALGVGAGALAGARLLASGLRQRRAAETLARVGLGAAIVSLTLVGAARALGPTLEQCYAYQRYLRGDSALYQVPWEARTIDVYRATAPDGSLLVTDVALPLLGAAGLGERHTIVPLTQGEYWDKAPLRGAPQVVDRQRIIVDALRRGVPVYTDSFTVDPVRAHGPQDFERFLAIHQVQLLPLTTDGAITIYQLVPAP